MTDQIYLGQGDDRPALTSRQMEVLRLFCNGDGYKKIGKELFITVEAVKSHMQNIYNRLGLMDLEAKERQWRIREEVCPALKKDEFPINPDEEETDPEPVSTEDEDKLDEDEGAITKWKEKSPPPPPIPPPSTRPRIVNRPRPGIWLIVGFILGLIAMYVAYPRLFASEPEEIGGATTPVATGVSIVEQQTVIVSPTPEPVSSTTEPQVVVVTATLPLPTPTSETIPVQAAGYIFSDDFENGPDPLWEVQIGEPGMANGKYTVIASFSETFTEHFALLKQNYWGNISITFELAPFGEIFVSQSANALGAVVIRFNEGEDGIGLLLHPKEKGVQFGVLSQEGEWIPHSGSLVSGEDGDFDLDRTANQFTIDAIGNTYIVYINEKQITSATIPGAEIGQIGLWFEINKQEKFVDVNEYAARFEHITIEAIP